MRFIDSGELSLQQSDSPTAEEVRALVERLRSNEPLAICPYDRKSPEYWTTDDVTPCKFCGQLNDPAAPDKCRGADTRVMGEAASTLLGLLARAEGAEKERDEANAWRRQFDYCMCGSLVDGHGVGDGHSPVSEYDYRLDQSEARAEAAEKRAEGAERERDEARSDRNGHADHVLRMASECADGLAALEHIDECWEACGQPGNRSKLSLSEQISSIARELDSASDQIEVLEAELAESRLGSLMARRDRDRAEAALTQTMGEWKRYSDEKPTKGDDGEQWLLTWCTQTATYDVGCIDGEWTHGEEIPGRDSELWMWLDVNPERHFGEGDRVIEGEELRNKYEALCAELRALDDEAARVLKAFTINAGSWKQRHDDGVALFSKIKALIERVGG